MTKVVFFIFSVSLLISSCTEPQKNEKKDLLSGSWIFESGTKNGSTDGIELLNNLVFEFSDKTFSCELLPEMKPGLKKEENYIVKENKILVGDKLDMEIKDISEENLFIKFNLILGDEPIDFDLKFNRQ